MTILRTGDVRANGRGSVGRPCRGGPRERDFAPLLIGPHERFYTTERIVLSSADLLRSSRCINVTDQRSPRPQGTVIIRVIDASAYAGGARDRKNSRSMGMRLLYALAEPTARTIGRPPIGYPALSFVVGADHRFRGLRTRSFLRSADPKKRSRSIPTNFSKSTISDVASASARFISYLPVAPHTRNYYISEPFLPGFRIYIV